MSSKIQKVFFISMLIASLAGCKQSNPSLHDLSELEILYQNQDIASKVIIYDAFTPPVASRIYVYTSLAFYEAIRFTSDTATSLTEKLHGFSKMPVPEPGRAYNYTLAATKAFFTVLRNIKVFSADSLNNYESSVYEQFREKLDTATFARSMQFGDTIAKTVMIRAKNDGYLQSRGKPKFLGSQAPGKWRPTPPDYLDGVEWCWNTMKPMVLDSASQFPAPGPPEYNPDTSSIFFKDVMEVYNTSIHLTKEQKSIAQYWDDNPFVMQHAGHLMYGTKKLTPGGHWMSIAAIASKQSNADIIKTAKCYALTAIALYDAFIACWDIKYKSNFVRPVTVINEILDKTYQPFLQTPPFPEYTSGHSTITASAATVLSHLFGNNFAFLDTSEMKYIGMQRHFNSFLEAAGEASISRLYGGIHFRHSINDGAAQGRKVGELIVSRLMHDTTK